MLKRCAFLLGPIVYADLLKVARNKRWYVLRVILGLLLLYVIYESYAYPIFYRGYHRSNEFSHMEMRLMADRLFMQLVVCQFVAICCLTPVLTAGAIAEEKQRKTLHYLLTSQLSSFEIVIGKLFSRFFILVLPVAISLPVMVMLGLLGSIDPLMVVCGYGGILTIALFEASLAILMSTLARRGRDALIRTFIVGLAWVVGPWLVEAMSLTRADPWPAIYKACVEPINRHLIMTSPLFLTAPTGMPGNYRGAFAGPWGWMWALGTMIAHQWVGIVILLSLAVWQLRPAFRRQDGAPASRTPLVRSIRGKIRRWWPHKPVGDDAMLWKETEGMPGALALNALAYGAVILVGMCAYETLKDLIPIAYSELKRDGYSAGAGYARYQLNHVLRAINTAFFCVASLVLASLASTSISREREDDTWISLVSTPLDGWDILRPKLIGAIRGIRGLLVAIGVVWCFGLVIGSFHPLGVLISMVQLVVFLSFILGLGTLISLRAKTTMRAIGLTMGILVFLAVVLPMLISMFGRGNERVAGITSQPYMFACGQLTYDELDYLLLRQGGGHQRFPLFSSLHEIASINILGTSAYVIASATLLILSFKLFDRLVDRPRHSGLLGSITIGEDERDSPKLRVDPESC